LGLPSARGLWLLSARAKIRGRLPSDHAQVEPGPQRSHKCAPAQQIVPCGASARMQIMPCGASARKIMPCGAKIMPCGASARMQIMPCGASARKRYIHPPTQPKTMDGGPAPNVQIAPHGTLMYDSPPQHLDTQQPSTAPSTAPGYTTALHSTWIHNSPPQHLWDTQQPSTAPVDDGHPTPVDPRAQPHSLMGNIPPHGTPMHNGLPRHLWMDDGLTTPGSPHTATQPKVRQPSTAPGCTTAFHGTCG